MCSFAILQRLWLVVADQEVGGNPRLVGMYSQADHTCFEAIEVLAGCTCFVAVETADCIGLAEPGRAVGRKDSAELGVVD